MGDPGYYVHPSSVVDPGAIIGEGTKIRHFRPVFFGAMVGAGFVVTTAAARERLAIPVFPERTEAEIGEIVAATGEFYG